MIRFVVKELLGRVRWLCVLCIFADIREELYDQEFDGRRRMERKD
jgi:hypothetical protein